MTKITTNILGYEVDLTFHEDGMICAVWEGREIAFTEDLNEVVQALKTIIGAEQPLTDTQEVYHDPDNNDPRPDASRNRCPNS